MYVVSQAQTSAGHVTREAVTMRMLLQNVCSAQPGPFSANTAHCRFCGARLQDDFKSAATDTKARLQGQEEQGVLQQMNEPHKALVPQSTPVLQDRCHTWHVEPVSASDVQLEQMVEKMVKWKEEATNDHKSAAFTVFCGQTLSSRQNETKEWRDDEVPSSAGQVFPLSPGSRGVALTDLEDVVDGGGQRLACGGYVCLRFATFLGRDRTLKDLCVSAPRSGLPFSPDLWSAGGEPRPSASGGSSLAREAISSLVCSCRVAPTQWEMARVQDAQFLCLVKKVASGVQDSRPVSLPSLHLKTFLGSGDQVFTQGTATQRGEGHKQLLKEPCKGLG
ncbi:unnamed protein product [Pleuronectes platessa]|uniref:Uncharacterized protein n=1 Tax=Pleuronectes platessa TaxID=8262 RepID=A0A9N7TSF4_PLEPL|nr:unnamed protein product [Pleuronectes platessa]